MEKRGNNALDIIDLTTLVGYILKDKRGSEAELLLVKQAKERPGIN